MSDRIRVTLDVDQDWINSLLQLNDGVLEFNPDTVHLVSVKPV